LTFEEVRDRLSGCWNDLADLPARALAKFKRHVASSLVAPSGRLRSTAIHDYMINELRLMLNDLGLVGGLDLIHSRGRWLLRGRDVLVQFKKIDKRGHASNYPTDAAMAFNQTQFQMPGLARSMRVTLGYRLDKTNSEVVEVSLVAFDNNKRIWRESVEAQLPLPLPIHTSTATPAKAPARTFKPKKEALEARGTENKDKKTRGE